MLAETAPLTFMEKLPTRENDYFEAATAFANWYRETLGRLRRRLRANAMLEFYSVVLAELDRRREASLSFFARIDRINHVFEDRAQRLLERGGQREQGGDANRFILDVEVLQDHRTGRRMWAHLYHAVVTPGDLQISDALPRLAEIASAGGTEQDIQRRIIDNLLEVTSRQLRPRIAGARDSLGLHLDAELEREARIAIVSRQLLQDGPLPSPDDPRWAKEMGLVERAAIDRYIQDKLDFAASKCQPFITLAVGAPYLPEKAYCVVARQYRESLGQPLRQLSSLPMDGGQLIDGENPHKLIFYVAKLGCALHAIKSLVDYERRYLAVKEMELAESGKVPGLPRGVPQIPIHQDSNWEGAPDSERRLFRVSIDGVKTGDAKLAWIERNKAQLAEAAESAEVLDDLKDFTLGVAFGYIAHHDDGPAGPGYYLEDDSLVADDRRLGKFRDQAFARYRKRNDAQKKWLHKQWMARLAAIEEERDYAALKQRFADHEAALDTALKNAERLGGKPFAEHVRREKESFHAYRVIKGW
ncbi:MAG: hypothetical protein AAGC55_06040 [Myxococcota bacterium]